MRPDILYPYFKSLSSFPFIGPKRAKLLSEKIGATSLDVCFHLPIAIEERIYVKKIKECEPNKLYTLTLEITGYEQRKSSFIIYGTDGEDVLSITYFHASFHYLKKLFPIGDRKLVSGKVDYFMGHPQMVHPDFVGYAYQREKWTGVHPLYSRIGSVGRQVYRNLVETILPTLPDLPEWISEEIIAEKKWPSFKKAIERVHHPTSLEDLSPLSPARARLAYDELRSYQIALKKLSLATHEPEGKSHGSSGTLLKKALTLLPFELTEGQQSVLKDLKEIIASPRQMRGLLMGDVGSGKTVVAFLSALDALENGHQAALLAPTEILAEQHAQTLKPWCDALGIPSTLLTGSLSASEKKKRKATIQEGSIRFIIGTHALLQQDITFQQLCYVVVDEQHRFGVEQRQRLIQSGAQPDILYMSATPIPRTLAMTLYGEMEVFTLKEKPANRKPILTRILSTHQLKDLYAGLDRILSAQGKIYWVCPLVEESEILNLTSVTERFEELKKRFSCPLFMMHGQMKGSEKNAVMQVFKEAPKGILVSTTLIEVGVDVPEATTIIIEHADRYGLSQLHQLRGRVGRGSQESYCILLYKPPLSTVGKKRLEVIRNNNDGFLIAEEDLKLRGSGDILGTQQSGVPSFKFANLHHHFDLLLLAKKETETLDVSNLSQREEMILELFKKEDVSSI